MQLVVDASILVSFFRDNPVRFVIINADTLGLKLSIPEYAIGELKKNESDILKYSKFNSEQFNEALSTLTKFVESFPNDSFKEFESKAGKISPHKSDKDTPYFALALKLNCPIWSNEPKFKNQSSVKVFNTRELLKLLGISN